MANVSSDREILKAKWNEARLTMDLDCEAPDTYPRTPDMLLLTHPAIYHRAYVGNEQPILPPSTMDADSLEILKNTTGCRSTKGCQYNDHTVRLTRHRSTLETMLVLGKLCPQRRVHATRITRRRPCVACPATTGGDLCPLVTQACATLSARPNPRLCLLMY